MDTTSVEQLNDIGSNPGHDKHLDIVNSLSKKRSYKLSRVLRNITKNKNLGINRVRNLYPKRRNVSLKESKPKRTPTEIISKFRHFDGESGKETLTWVN